MKTRLLVSVRDRDEALDALAAGADWIDLKEPHRGALGWVDANVMREVVAALGARVSLSVALGELLDGPAIDDLPPGIQLAKLGLAGCASQADWPEQLATAASTLPAGTGAVAVIYADDELAGAPPAADVLRLAVRIGCQAGLVDTWRKDAGGLLDHWTIEQCAAFVRHSHEDGLMAVLAGSLTADCIARLLPLGADYVAVRGAACSESRTGRLCSEKVRVLAELVHGAKLIQREATPPRRAGERSSACG
jgi:uncharacterized protein (UPF0264 family)